MKSKKNLVIIIIGIVITIVGIGFYFWDKSNVTILGAKKYGLNCKIERTCGNLVGIDCDAAVDGPYYYINKKTGKIISRCGGYCMGNKCVNCPPKEWNCETY